MSLPTILVSNDDGYLAQGVQTLARALAPLGRVVVVAPAIDQSAVSHSMSLRRPLRLQRFADINCAPHQAIEVYAVDGTPTDAVYMAAHHILRDTKPALVVSGINHGANLGNDILYSGTVSAAMEGVFLDIPSVAMSLVGNHDLDFVPAGRFAFELCRTLLKHPLPKGALLNVNVPKRIVKPGFAVTCLGKHDYAADVEERKDPRGQSYYWIGGQWSGYQDLPGTDCKAVADGQISVTPIEMKLTCQRLLPWVEKLQLDQFAAFAEYKNASEEKL